MQSLQLGRLLDPERTSYPEMAQLRMFEDLVELAIFMGNPTEQEKADLNDGGLQFAAVDAAPHLLIFGYQLGSQSWCDAPFEAHRVTHDLSAFVFGQGRPLPLRILLVNSEKGILEGWRFGELPAEFVDFLRAAVRSQLAEPNDPDTAAALLDHLYSAFPTPAELFEQFASATCAVS